MIDSSGKSPEILSSLSGSPPLKGGRGDVPKVSLLYVLIDFIIIYPPTPLQRGGSGIEK
jgi:hypothetical protein